MATRLIAVPSKPFDQFPETPEVKARRQFLEASSRAIGTYDVIHHEDQNRPRGLILSLLADVPDLQSHLAELHPLPLESQASIDAENEEQAYDVPVPEDPDDLEDTEAGDIPPELQPVLIPSGLPPPSKPVSEMRFRKPDFDMDAMDLKNLPDWDPDNSGEAGFYSAEALYAWIRADQEACARGAQPVLYESFSSPRTEQWGEPVMDHVITNLAPILLICQIPASKSDDEFRTMYDEYAYMTSLEEWQRVSCYKQTDPLVPRWLLVQEFKEDLWQARHYLDLKKQEAEYLWRKKGWEGVRLEFFRVRR